MAQTLYPAPLTAILAAIAAQNKGVTLNPAQYTFGAPTPYADPAGVENTSMLITVSDVTAPYQGAQTVYYKRLNLADLTTLLPQPILGNGWATVADFWAVLNANFGLNFVAGDLNDTDALVINGDGTGSVTLKAQAASRGWIGQVTLSFAIGNYDISQAIANTALPGLLWPNTDFSKPFGELYSYFRDMTPYQSDMQQYTTASNNLSQLATNLAALTGNPWIVTAASRYSLQGATVQYNGLVKNFVALSDSICTPNPGYQYVLVVKLNPSYSLGYSGYLFLHYGLIDPYANTDTLPAVKTVMLLHFDDINGSKIVTDNAVPARVFNANGDAVIGTAHSLYGGSSAQFDGTGNFSTADSTDLHLTGDYTIEFDLYVSGVAAAQQVLSKGATAGFAINAGNLIATDDAGNTLTAAVTAGAFTHVALVKKNGTTALYIAGQLAGTSNTMTTFGTDTTTGLFIGSKTNGTGGLSGWIEEFRISNVARYTASFDPFDTQFYVD